MNQPSSLQEDLHRESQRLNGLLHLEVLRLRAAHLLSPGELRGLYLSTHTWIRCCGRRVLKSAELPRDVESLSAKAEQLREKNRQEQLKVVVDPMVFRTADAFLPASTHDGG